MKKKILSNKIIFILTVAAILVLNLQTGWSASSKDTETENIKQVWVSFVKKLSAKDIEGALKYVVDERREDYRQAFSLIKDKLPKEMSKKEEIRINEVYGNMATGENIVTENGGVYSYPVVFIKEKGKWKIQSF